MKFLVEILGFFSVKLCFTVLYYFCINLIIIIASDVLTAKCFDFCRSSSGYSKRKVIFFLFLCTIYIVLLSYLLCCFPLFLVRFLVLPLSYLPGYCTYVYEWCC